jgi:hypothetical protein
MQLNHFNNFGCTEEKRPVELRFSLVGRKSFDAATGEELHVSFGVHASSPPLPSPAEGGLPDFVVPECWTSRLTTSVSSNSNDMSGFSYPLKESSTASNVTTILLSWLYVAMEAHLLNLFIIFVYYYSSYYSVIIKVIVRIVGLVDFYTV